MVIKNTINTSNKKVLKFQRKEKLKRLIENLNVGLIGKEDIIKTSLLSILAQENLILFGPPGTAKSEISRRISNVVDTGNYFEYLLTKFTTPEEIFGPLSIKELKEDRFYRKTEGYLPTVQIGFLDEIFKANSSILNTLLTIMNEKIFHNGSKKESTNLISLIGASNEDPSNDLELNALYDRFLIRKVVEYVQDDELNKFFDIPNEKFKLNENLKITLKEIQEIEENLNKVTIPNEIRDIIIKIKLDLKDEFKNNSQEDISDRKFMKTLKLLKISAYTNERTQVDISDVLLLKNCLWNNPESQKVVNDTIINNIKDGYKLIEIFNEDKFSGIHNDRTLKKFDFKGMGTESDPFIIEDENDLIHIGTTDYLDKGYYFKQSKDISIVSHWHSIGSEEKPFKGNYNGNNKSITKLNNALFFQLKESTVENLNLKEVNINIKLEKVGGIANISIDSCIRNCNIEGDITTTNNNTTYGGGVVGYVKEGNIRNCNVSGNISSSSSYSSYYSYSYGGGIVGYVEKANIQDCNVSGSISPSSSSSSYSYSYGGGIVGYVKEGNIQNCNVSGSISSSSYCSYGGGMVGYVEKANIQNCNVSGSISSYYSSYSSYSSYGGGIVGYAKEGNIQNCNISGSISSKTYGGIAGLEGDVNFKKNYISSVTTINNNKINSSDENRKNGKSLDPSHFNEKFYKRLGWDFKNIWIWDDNNNTPVLRQMNNISENVVVKSSIEKNELSNILNNNIWI
ncbi:MAG: AAA family ATPase [Cetobacterium sp.]